MEQEMIETAIASLGQEDRDALTALCDYATAAGFLPFVSTVGNKANNFKIELKKAKFKPALFTARIDAEKYTLRVKLYHLNEYAEMLSALTPQSLASLLNSGGCGHHGGGCKGPIQFSYDGKSYEPCRHGMQFHALPLKDIPVLCSLFEREIECGST